MTSENANDARFSGLQRRLLRIGGILLGVFGLVLFFAGGALIVLGFGLVWWLRRKAGEGSR